MKSGIDYFPLDVELDTKFELIEAEFGLTGFAVIVKLFQRIYGEQGYYGEWTNEVALLFGRRAGLGGNAVSEIVTAAIKRGIFDKTLYDKYQILTSRGIQERYFEIVSRRKNVKAKREYLMACVIEKLKGVDIYSENVNISKQRKVKERKVKESKVKESKGEDITRAGAEDLPPPKIPIKDNLNLYQHHCPDLADKETKLPDNGYKNAQALNTAIEEGFTLQEAETLFKRANSAEWLKQADNITLAWILERRQNIMAGAYDKIFGKEGKSVLDPLMRAAERFLEEP